MPRIVTVTLNPALDLSTETAEVRPNRKLRCAPPRRDPGGGGVNVSRAIAKLGGASLCAVAAGGDAGAALLALLAAEGVEARDLGLDLPTRQSLAVTDLASGDQFRFVMPGPVWSAADLDRALARVVGWCAAGDWLVPSGSLPEGVPPDTFPKLGARLAGTGVRMVLDTSGSALVAAAQARGLALLRMDDAEAEALAGTPLPRAADSAGLARRLVGDGVAAMVQVARGAEGTVLATAEGCWLCRPPKVAVVSAVGAGDSHLAGVVLALARGADPLTACIAGVGAAASAVTTPDTALCRREDAEAYARQVVVEPL